MFSPAPPLDAQICTSILGCKKHLHSRRILNAAAWILDDENHPKTKEGGEGSSLHFTYGLCSGEVGLELSEAQSLLLKLLLLESPVLLQTVQLWAVLSHLSQRKEGNGTDGTGTSVPYLETWFGDLFAQDYLCKLML